MDEERLSNLGRNFCIDINWEQKKSWFGFINNIKKITTTIVEK